jgi:hypothetical protein
MIAEQADAHLVGRRVFTDGTERDIFEDAAGQYVLDADGLPVSGQWLPPPDEPLVIDGRDGGPPQGAQG